jgi:uncharacterized protein (TIGR03437 family)
VNGSSNEVVILFKPPHRDKRELSPSLEWAVPASDLRIGNYTSLGTALQPSAVPSQDSQVFKILFISVTDLTFMNVARTVYVTRNPVKASPAYLQRTLSKQVIEAAVQSFLAFTLIIYPVNAQIAGTSVITTIAGQKGRGAFSGDGGPGATAQLSFDLTGTGNYALAFDTDGNLYVADSGNNRVRKISKDGIISTVVGSGGFGLFGDGGPATQASLNTPASLAVDAQKNIYVADLRNQRVRRVTPAGIISTFAGGGSSSPDLLQVQPLSSATQLKLDNIFDVTLDNRGYLLIGENVAVAPTGKPEKQCCIGVFDKQGNNYYVSDTRILRNGTTFAGTGVSGNFGDGGPALAAQFGALGPLALDAAGNLYAADTKYYCIRRIGRDGTVSTVVGRPQLSQPSGVSNGDGGPAASAYIGYVRGMAFDPDGNLYFAELRAFAFPGSDDSSLIRKVARSPEAVTTGPAPSISASGVLNAATFSSLINPGSWVTLFGENLAAIPSPGRAWYPDEIRNGLLPTSLEGVTVRFDGKPAAISFVGPTQLNVLVPDDVKIGIIPVEVETPNGVARSNANVRVYAPSLFVTAKLGLNSLAAAVHLDGTVVGRATVLSGSRSARPGDVILLYGSGFGASNPAMPSNRLQPPAPLQAAFGVTIGGVQATTRFGGIVGPGLVQFNVQIPELPDGDHAVVVAAVDTFTQSGVVVPVQR